VDEIDRRTLLRRAGLLTGTGVVAGLAGCQPGRPSGRAGGGAAGAAGGWAAVRSQFDLNPGKRHLAAFVLASHPRPVAEAVERHLQLGKRQVAERTRALAARLKDGLAAIPAVRLVTPRAPELSAGIVCLDVGDLDPDQAVAGLRRQGVLASVTPYAAPHLRLGPSIVTSEADVDAAVQAVHALA
jgi:selenocysteine lyase/cysteine desulfurase